MAPRDLDVRPSAARHGRRPLLAWLLLLGLAGLPARAARRPRAPTAPIPMSRRTLVPDFRPQGAGPLRVAFFDADSTLRVSRSGSVSANGPRDVMLLPGVPARLAALAAEGYLIAVVSNQAGVADGHVSLETADRALRFMARLLARQGGRLHYYDFAEARDGFRKPGTGMADELARVVQATLGRPIDWRGSFMVGDSAWKQRKDREPDGTPGEDFSNSDRLFAEAVRAARRVPDGFAFHHPRDFFGWHPLGVRNFHRKDEVLRFRAAHPDF